MQELGEKLKNKRLELGFELDDIADKTKIDVKKLNAIEDGNVEYFKDNLSYLKYYVKNYYVALGLDFNEDKDILSEEINSFTQQVDLARIREIDEMKNNINRRVNSAKIETKQKKKGLDLSAIILIIVLSLIVVVIFIGVKYLINDNNSYPQASETPTVIVTPTTETTPTPTTDVVETVEPIITVTEESADTYIISSDTLEENIKITASFGIETWARVKIDNVITEVPAMRNYQEGETFTISTPYVSGKIIEINLGRLISNTFTINNEPLELDESIKDGQSGQKLFFKFE